LPLAADKLRCDLLFVCKELKYRDAREAVCELFAIRAWFGVAHRKP
jgi:hypothetical protein